jgi:hypothetical protein
LDLLERENPRLCHCTRSLRVSPVRLKVLAKQIDEVLIAVVQELEVLADTYGVLLDERGRLDERERKAF